MRTVVPGSSHVVPKSSKCCEALWREFFAGGPGVKASPSKAGGAGSIPGPEARIPYAVRPKNKTNETEQKQKYNRFDKGFKRGPQNNASRTPRPL